LQQHAADHQARDLTEAAILPTLVKRMRRNPILQNNLSLGKYYEIQVNSLYNGTVSLESFEKLGRFHWKV
jgi:hypothetical protein